MFDKNLSESLKEYKMNDCKFCNMDLDSEDREECGEGYAPSVLLEKYESEVHLVAYGDDETNFKVAYCPKCGRKL